MQGWESVVLYCNCTVQHNNNTTQQSTVIEASDLAHYLYRSLSKDSLAILTKCLADLRWPILVIKEHGVEACKQGFG